MVYFKHKKCAANNLPKLWSGVIINHEYKFGNFNNYIITKNFIYNISHVDLL